MKLLVIISLLIAANSWGLSQKDGPGIKAVTETHDEGGLLIYPMPVKGDAFRISGINTLKIQAIQVFDLTGKLVGEIGHEEIDENGEVSVDHFNEGTYLLSIIFDDHTIKRKIIIE